MEFKDRLKQLRKEHNWTQSDIGEVLDVETEIIEKYESGEESPYLDEVITLTMLFGVSLSYLIGETLELNERQTYLYNEPHRMEQKAHALEQCINLLENGYPDVFRRDSMIQKHLIDLRKDYTAIKTILKLHNKDKEAEN